jgi:hypothetical protein
MADAPHNSEVLSRAWYGASITEFLHADSDAIVGRLTTNSDFAVLPAQRAAWLVQICLLKAHLVGLTGTLFMEFSIPRMGRRLDTVLLIGPIVFPIEFKVGDSIFDRAGVDQVWDYALDLKNFHEASHWASIVPLLIATGADASPPIELRVDDDRVFRPIPVHAGAFRKTLDDVLRLVRGDALDSQHWACAPYHPTPTIIEAARALYAQHSVEAIARYDAGAQNLRVTSCRIEQLVDDARARQRKVICLVLNQV